MVKKLSNSQKTRVRAAFKKIKASHWSKTAKRKLRAALRRGGYMPSRSRPSSSRPSSSRPSSSRPSSSRPTSSRPTSSRPTQTNTFRSRVKSRVRAGIDRIKNNTAAVKKFNIWKNIINIAARKYGANSPQVRKIRAYVQKNEKLEVKRVRENNTTSNKRNIENDFKRNKPKINEKVIFSKKWNSPERMWAAKKHWIKNYTWTARQNILLRRKIRENNNIPSKKVEKNTIEKNTIANQTKKNTFKRVKPVKRLTAQEQNKKHIDKLQELRLSGKTDSDLLSRVEAKFWKDSKEYIKAKWFLKDNPFQDWTNTLDSTIITKEKKVEDLNKKQIDIEKETMEDKIMKANENYNRTLMVLWNNEERMQSFLSESIKRNKILLEEMREASLKALERTKTTELNKITGRIRALLARRWINIGNIPPEQLLAMSGELWSQALEKINEATTDMENKILEVGQESEKVLLGLQKEWILNENEFNIAIEKTRQLTQTNIRAFKDNFITNTFKIARANIQDKDNNKAEVINTVSKFITQLGISGTAQVVMEKYLDNLNSVEALKEMIADLGNENSELYKAVADVEKAAELQRQLEHKVAILRATPRSSWSWTKKTGLRAAQINILLANGINPDWYSHEDYLAWQTWMRNEWRTILTKANDQPDAQRPVYQSSYPTTSY